MKTHSIEWAAGLLEGEGSFIVNQGYPSIQCSMKDRDVLESLQEVVGGGNITEHGQAGVWQWRLTDTKLTIKLAKYIRPYLHERRKKQIDEVIKVSNKIVNRDSRELHGKLSKEQVRKIYKSTLSNQILAEYYEVSPSTISSIKNGKTWSDVTKNLKRG